MPEDVRKAYLGALAWLRDANNNGIPDVFESGAGDTVIGVQQSSITLNGRTIESSELPTWARPLVERAIGQVGASSVGSPRPAGDEPREGLDPAQMTLGPVLAFLAGFTLIFAIGLMFAIGGGPEHLGGRMMIAIVAWLFLGWLDTHATRLARRRESLLGPDSPGYRRFIVWSSVGLLLAAALLLGLALYLP
jgi:hypothetical protein